MSEQSGQRQTVIDAGTGFKGNFDSDCPIVVKGRIEGQMTAPSLTVDAGGSVSGTVKVKELRSEGEIAGEYDADYVKLSGIVKDNTIIRAKTLEVNLSPPTGRMQITFGRCELEVGDVPDKSAAIAAADGTPSASEAKPPAPQGTAPTAATEDAFADSDAEPNESKKRGRERRSNAPPQS